jgi:predicted PurR-regulated permease PerM
MSTQQAPLAKFLIVFAAFVIVVSGLKMASSMVVPFLLAVFIAMIVSPLLAWLKQRRVPGSIAILLIISLILSVGLILGAVIGSSVESFRQDIPAYSAKLAVMSEAIQQGLVQRGIAIDAEQWQSSFDPSAVMRWVGSALASFGNVMTNSVLILLTVIFILAENTSFGDKLRMARGDQNTPAWLAEFSRSIHGYLAIKAAISAVTGVLIYLWLTILGVDYAVLWGLIAFLLNFVPTVGSFIAAVPAVLLALVQLGLGSAGLTLCGFVVVNFLMGSAIEPRWMGKGLNLSPLVVFVSLVFWGWVLGPVGMLLSIPLTIMVKIALGANKGTQWISIMLGGSETLSREKC